MTEWLHGAKGYVTLRYSVVHSSFRCRHSRGGANGSGPPQCTTGALGILYLSHQESLNKGVYVSYLLH